MRIDRNELLQEIMLRKLIQKIIRKKSGQLIHEKYNRSLKEQKLRKVIRNLMPNLIKEESDQTKQEVAIALVRDTLLDTIKIINKDQGKFKDPEVQDGFRKYIMLALQNDFEENRGEEGEADPVIDEPTEEETVLSEPPEEEKSIEDQPEGDLVLEFADNLDGVVDIKVKPSEDPMYIPAEEEKEQKEEDEISGFEERSEELYLTLTDAEKVGFRYAPRSYDKATKQIKRIHKIAIPDPEIVAMYEKWLKKNFELHGENTKEETAFESGGDAEAEEATEADGNAEADFEM